MRAAHALPMLCLQCALEFLLRTGRQPDILHCHDWSSADVAKYYWTEYHNYGLWKPNVVRTRLPCPSAWCQSIVCPSIGAHLLVSIY